MISDHDYLNVPIFRQIRQIYIYQRRIAFRKVEKIDLFDQVGRSIDQTKSKL